MSNTIDTNALLTQLKSMASQAGIAEKSDDKIQETPVTDFTAVLKDSVEHVNNRNQQAVNLATAFERGDTGVELSDVMIEMQKARISFETLSQVRNKVVSAYQEIMNMPI